MVFTQPWQTTCALTPRAGDKKHVICVSLSNFSVCLVLIAAQPSRSHHRTLNQNISTKLLQPYDPHVPVPSSSDGNNSHSARANSKMHEPAASNSADEPLSSSVNDGAKPSVPMRFDTGRTDSRSMVYHTGWRLYALTAR
jgi:hypothetical protein